MWLQHYLMVGHAKRHHKGLLLDRSGDAAFGNHQTLRRARFLAGSGSKRALKAGCRIGIVLVPTLTGSVGWTLPVPKR